MLLLVDVIQQQQATSSTRRGSRVSETVSLCRVAPEGGLIYQRNAPLECLLWYRLWHWFDVAASVCHTLNGQV